MAVLNSPEQLSRQISFLVETEKLKTVLRRTSPINAARRENSAEHSWTLALMAIVLSEHANQQLDLPRVLRMLLIHDLVEIDAGDTFCYDTEGNATKADREACAAERIFGLLPEAQAGEFRELWREFDTCASAEATFANSLDRLMPLLQNFHNGGGSWRKHGVTCEQALDHNRHIRDGSTILWDYAQTLLKKAQQLDLFSHAHGKT